MSTVTETPVTRRAAQAPASPYRLTFPRLLRSEWIKATTIRSTWWSLAVAAVLSIGIAMMIAAAAASFPGEFPPVSAILSPTQFTMLVAGILGALVITGEYSKGMIRSTLTAQPRRLAVVLSKAIAVAALMAVATVIIYAISIGATAALLPSAIDWADPSQSIVPLAYGVLSMVCFTLIGLGFGFVIRNGAGAIAATVGVLFVLPIVLGLFQLAGESWQWIVDLSKYLPMAAAGTLTTPGTTDVAVPLITLGAWVVGLLALGAVVLRTRDA